MRRINVYVILIGITCILLTLYVKSAEGFQDAPKKRFALIIRGEAFRKGGQHNRTDGRPETYDEQKEACKTHMDLVNKIRESGYDVDVFIDSYHTNYDEDLVNWYQGSVKDKRFHTTKFNTQRKLIEDALDMVKSSLQTYDALMVLRIDLFLKQKFVDEYNPDTDTVQFPFVMWTLNIKTPGGNPMITDTVFHFPKRHFDKLHGLYSGNSWGDSNHAFLDIIPLEYEKDYSLMTKHLHDSDSAKDFNPFYKMIGRAENPVWYDGETKEFPRDFPN